MQIRISEDILNALKTVRLGILSFRCEVIPSNSNLLEEIEILLNRIANQHLLDSINKSGEIHNARLAYKACGKDPSRYRPSAESLMRRIVKDRGLYQVNNVVDILNYISIFSGVSIGGYDSDMIQGSVLFDICKENIKYLGIGRGELNIVGLPALFDEAGPFGTPTSDSVRTMINSNTKNSVYVFFDFGKRKELPQDIECSKSMLTKYASAKDFKIEYME
jgi:DNA/RNA-binding domain of Phe-tRNA-synthetase-like protein